MSPTSASAPAKRDEAEPNVGNVTVPIWLIFIFGGLFYWSQVYLSDHAGEFNERVYMPFTSSKELAFANPVDPYTQKLRAGQIVFEKTCVACHQPGGQGKEGVAPPLAGSEWVQAPGPGRIERIVLNGFTGPVTVEGKDYNLNMLAWRDTYNDEEIADVLTYIRNSFGNHASEVKKDQVAEARKEKHPSPMTAPELQQIQP